MLEVLRYIHTKDQSNAMSMSKQCRRCPRYTTLLKDFNALNSMYVKDVKDGVCGFYTALHTEYYYSSHSCWRCQRCQILCTQCIQWPLVPARREGYMLQYSIWKAFHLGDLAVHHQSVWGGSFVNFLGLVNYKGDCRQDTQPIPNS